MQYMNNKNNKWEALISLLGKKKEKMSVFYILTILPYSEQKACKCFSDFLKAVFLVII